MTTADHNTCHRCGASITGFTRIIVDGNAFHAGCAPVRATEDDGGPAFPREDYQLERAPGQCGMSLRDYFAAAALTTLKIEYLATTSAGMHGASFGTTQPVFSQDSPATIARRAYWIADAMLAERKQAKP